MRLLKGIKCKSYLTNIQAFAKNMYFTGQTYSIYWPAKITNDSSKQLVVTFLYIATYSLQKHCLRILQCLICNVIFPEQTCKMYRQGHS